MPEQIEISQLVPHAKPLLLLDKLVSTSNDSIRCELIVRDDGLFDSDGRVPALTGIEYMAQTVAAFAGLKAHKIGLPPKLGFLLGTRKFTTNVASFSCGDRLTVTVTEALQSANGMGAFKCTVEGSEVLQTATLAVYQPNNPIEFLTESRHGR